jgi:serine/threonine protein kinase
LDLGHVAARRSGVAGDGGLNWRRGTQIGRGSFGVVYKAMDNITGLLFAVKEANVDTTISEDRKYVERLEVEVGICKDLRHPNIVSYLGHQYVGGSLYIYMEYVSGGSMAHVLSEFGPLKPAQMEIAARGLTEGLDYLHSRNPPVIHRDIKGANILVGQDFCVKLADFGCSKRSLDTKSFTTIGSVPWMAPEVIQQRDGYGRKADLWSLGCTLIEMATAEPPWGKSTFNNFMFALSHIALSGELPPIPAELSDTCRDFISRCVQRAADDRPTAEELLTHEFIACTAVERGA